MFFLSHDNSQTSPAIESYHLSKKSTQKEWRKEVMM
jgi:hypothetical protein